MRRVDEAVRSVVGDAVSGEISDPRLGFVTVTGVETSPDLRHARVFVSVLGDETERQETLDALTSAHGRLQHSIATQLRLKHTPELEFIYDESIDRGIRIDEILEVEEDAE
jgi:ribosome-binding factor A